MKALLALFALPLFCFAGCASEEQRAIPVGEPRRWTVERPVQPSPEKRPVAPPSRSPDRVPGSAADQAPSLDDPHVRSYNTGDRKEWPRIDPPLVIEIDSPEVPENITQPTPELTSP